MAVEPSSPRRAFFSLLGGNLLALLAAWWFDWSLFDLLWPYYLQNLVIGWYASRRMRALQQFTTDGFTINGRAIAPTPENRDRCARYLLIHYGIFHLGYLLFLLGLGFLVANEAAVDGEATASMRLPEASDYVLYGLIGLGFWVSQHLAHTEQVQVDRHYRPNLGALSFLPYLRVLPMHLMLIFGVAGLAFWIAVWWNRRDSHIPLDNRTFAGLIAVPTLLIVAGLWTMMRRRRMRSDQRAEAPR